MQLLNCTIRDGVAWLTLGRPEVLNAINDELANQFRACIDELEARPDVHVLVTHGEGRSFSAGSDLHELAQLSALEAAKYELGFAKIFSALDRLPQPTIAMLHGHVLGGGLGLALYHDLRIASDTACIRMPEVELGWIPPWAIGRLAEAVGFSNARWILLTCPTLTGKEAAGMGLVHEAIRGDQLRARVEEIAARLVSMPREGVTQTKALLNQMSPLRRFDWDAATSDLFRDCYEKPEAQKRLAEFLKRRKHKT